MNPHRQRLIDELAETRAALREATAAERERGCFRLRLMKPRWLPR